MVDFSQQDYKTMLFAALADMAAIAEQLGIQEMKEPGQIISAVREMQETEQRLRAEIARLQVIADRAVPDGWKLVPVEPNEAMLKKGALAYSQKERDMYSPTPTEEPGIGSEGYCYLAMLAAAPQPQDSTP